MTDQLREGDLDSLGPCLLLGRMEDPAETAASVGWPASDAVGQATDQTIAVEGGLVVTWMSVGRPSPESRQ